MDGSWHASGPSVLILPSTIPELFHGAYSSAHCTSLPVLSHQSMLLFRCVSLFRDEPLNISLMFRQESPCWHMKSSVIKAGTDPPAAPAPRHYKQLEICTTVMPNSAGKAAIAGPKQSNYIKCRFELFSIHNPMRTTSKSCFRYGRSHKRGVELISSRFIIVKLMLASVQQTPSTACLLGFRFCEHSLCLGRYPDTNGRRTVVLFAFPQMT